MKFRRRVKITVKVHTNDSKRKVSIPTRCSILGSICMKLRKSHKRANRKQRDEREA